MGEGTGVHKGLEARVGPAQFEELQDSLVWLELECIELNGGGSWGGTKYPSNILRSLSLNLCSAELRRSFELWRVRVTFLVKLLGMMEGCDWRQGGQEGGGWVFPENQAM